VTYRSRHLCIVLLGLFASTSCAETVAVCPPEGGVALQVLGSGGPIADDGRASTGYIVWVDGEARVLIDAGGGTFLRFGEAEAEFTSLDFVGLSHFHADHSADFPALLKSGNFSGRKRPLAIAGPGAGGPFPGLHAWLTSLIDGDAGAFGYLSGYLDGSGGLVKLEPVEISRDIPEPVTVFGDDESDLQIDTMPVPHGIVPALGFSVRVGDATIVFSSDQNGGDPSFIDFAKNANVLVMHMPIPEGATGGALQLHAPPSVIASIANEAEVETLLLSHFMARSLRNLEENTDVVREGFDGTIAVAGDLDCLVVTD